MPRGAALRCGQSTCHKNDGGMADILCRLWLLSLGMKKNLSDSNRLTRVAAAVVLWILSFIVSKSPLKIIFRLLGTVLGVSGAVGFCPAKCLLGGDQCPTNF